MNKYVSVMGLYVKMTLYKILGAEILFMTLAGLLMKFGKDSYYLDKVIGILLLIPFGIAIFLLLGALFQGKSNPDYALKKLLISEKEIVGIISLTAFAELMLVWLVQLFLFYGMGMFETIFPDASVERGAKNFVRLLYFNTSFKKMYPVHRMDLVICILVYLLLISIAIGIYNGYRLKGYTSQTWIFILPAGILFFLASGSKMMWVLALSYIPLILMEIKLIHDYRRACRIDD